MLKNRIVNFLNNHLGIQVIFSLLPSFLIVVYLCIYLADVGNIYSVLHYNDKITELELIYDSLKEVVSYNQNNDGSYNVTVKGSDAIPIDVNNGDKLFEVELLKENWLGIRVADETIYSVDSDLFTKIEKVDDIFKVYVNEQYFEANQYDIIAEVYINKQGYFEIRYPSDIIEPIETEYLTNAELLLVSDKTIRYNVVASYSTDIESYDINFVTNLPSDNVYFSEENYSLVKNISDDFALNFILGSNIYIVIFSMMIFCVLLLIIKREGDFKVLNRKEPFVMNCCFLSLLVLCIPFTFLMLG